jgi:hypothetical protein
MTELVGAHPVPPNRAGAPRKEVSVGAPALLIGGRVFGVSEFEFKTWLRHLSVTHKECRATKLFQTEAGVPGEMSRVFDWMNQHKCEKGSAACKQQPLF